MHVKPPIMPSHMGVLDNFVPFCDLLIFSLLDDNELFCVINCSARINRLTSTSGSWRLQNSASSYSMGTRSWGVSF